jgi:hypothetical protein
MGGRSAARERVDARAWLGAEIELILRERERLLQTAGAAASLFSALDPRLLPQQARESAHALGMILQALPEETLTDAMEAAFIQRGAATAH